MQRYSLPLLMLAVTFPAMSDPQDPGFDALQDTDWHVTTMGANHPVPQDVRITMRFADGRIAGGGGCNRYSAEVKSVGPGRMLFGPAMSTRMLCPPPQMQQETAFFARLGAVYGYAREEDHRLRLDYRLDDTLDSMWLEPAETRERP
jgi:heat shock protein HslJ